MQYVRSLHLGLSLSLHPGAMFFELRRQISDRGGAHYRQHARILSYEKRGTSRLFSLYAFPPGCDTVLFPGCTLSGTRPNAVIKLFDHIRESVPTLGIVFDCCTKPSHDLGRQEHFQAMFGQMCSHLIQNGIRKILFACPSCHQVFREHADTFSVSTVYEFLAEKELPVTEKLSGAVSIQDSCTVRFEARIQEAVRTLVSQSGLRIEEMSHSRETTLCCGEGGAACFVAPDVTDEWRSRRKQEAAGRPLIAYCAGCVNRLDPVTPTLHLLDLLFEPTGAFHGKARVSKSPFTYLNRLRLKHRFSKLIAGFFSR